MPNPDELDFTNPTREQVKATEARRGAALPPEDDDPPPAVSGELVRQAPAQVLPPAAMGAMALTEEDLGQFAEAVIVMKKVKLIALQVTGPKDWNDIGGQPYLNGTGCDKVARVFGVSFVDKKMDVRRLEDARGRPVEQYICTLSATFRGGSVQGIEGIASTDDDFFSHGGKQDFFEADIISVRKKAYTNAKNRALKALLGLGGFTWADIKGTVQQEEVAAVSFKDGKGGKAPAKGKAPAAAQDKEPMPEGAALDQAMWKMAYDLGAGDVREAERIHSECGTFETKEGKKIKGPARPERFVPGKHDKWKASTYGKLREAWKKHGPPTAAASGKPEHSEEEAPF